MSKRVLPVFALVMAFLAVSALAAMQNPSSSQSPATQGQATGQTSGPERRPMGPRLVGTVTSVGVDRFEIKSGDGSVHTILVDDQTRYREDQKDIQLEDLKVGDRVTVTGKEGSSPSQAASGGGSAAPPATSGSGAGSDQTGFAAATVRRVTEADLQRFQMGRGGPGSGRNAGERAFGEIVSIDNNQLKVKNPRTGEETVVVVDSQTAFTKDNQAAALKDLKVGDRIFAQGKTVNGQFTATRVMTGQMRGGGGGWRQRPLQN